MGPHRAALGATVGIGVLVAACGSADRSRQVIPEDAGRETGTAREAGPPPTPEAAPPRIDARPPIADAGPKTPDASDAGPVDAAVPLVGVFVNPATGLDTSPGTRAAPFKTIAQAAKAATSGQTIYLEDGIYDATNQSTFYVALPAGVTLRGVTKTGASLHGDAAMNGFVFSGTGGIHDVTFDTFASGFSASGAGTFDVSNVHFTSVVLPMYFKGSLSVTVDATGPDPILTNVVAGGLSTSLLATDDTTSVTFTGGDLEGDATANGQVFFARGSSKLTLDGTVLKNLNQRAVLGYDNADIVLKSVTIQSLTYAGAGPDSAVIAMGGQNTQPPIDPSLELQDTTISGNTAGGIGLALYSNLSSTPIVKLTRSHVDGNTGNGILVTAVSGALPGLVATIDLGASTLMNNTVAGIDAAIGTVSITGGEISGNGTDGVSLSGPTFKSSLTVRGGTVIKGNKGHGISFAGAATSTLDLGTAAAPGGIAFSGVAAAHAAVNLQALIQGTAIGNTWLPSIQGASATGLFTGAVTIAGGASGQNATVATGASLVVSR